MRNSLLITKTNKLRNLDEFNVEIQLSTKKTIITKNANKTIRALEHLGWNWQHITQANQFLTPSNSPKHATWMDRSSIELILFLLQGPKNNHKTTIAYFVGLRVKGL